MVINERDILGTQLIKRNEELANLYEKIKIQQSTLTKGNIYYNEKYQEVENFKVKIGILKHEIGFSNEETSCIPSMDKEVYLLEKEILDQ